MKKQSQSVKNMVARINNNTLNSNNELGISHVQQTPNGKFLSRITVAGTQFSLGSYKTPDEASAAYNGATKVYNKLVEKNIIR